jgi:hypothetical protein
LIANGTFGHQPIAVKASAVSNAIAQPGHRPGLARSPAERAPEFALACSAVEARWTGTSQRY